MSLDVVIDESPPQTPLVNTPLHTNEDGMALVDQFDFGCNDVMSSKDLSTELSSSSMDKHLYTLRPCDIFVDELGGDDLPPFDNWYTTGPAV
jgi:hypothetical protein